VIAPRIPMLPTWMLVESVFPNQPLVWFTSLVLERSPTFIFIKNNVHFWFNRRRVRKLKRECKEVLTDWTGILEHWVGRSVSLTRARLSAKAPAYLTVLRPSKVLLKPALVRGNTSCMRTLRSEIWLVCIVAIKTMHFHLERILCLAANR